MSEPQMEKVESMELLEIVEHLMSTHHEYLKQELPQIAELFSEVVESHGREHPQLVELRDTYVQLYNDLVPHLGKEEEVLFPALQAMERGGDLQGTCFGMLANPIAVMEHEHDVARSLFRRIRELTANYTAPPQADENWRALIVSLEGLEADTLEHIRKENDVLFPRALAAEAKHSG